jgi:predicted amidophosphoribosyltransferase
LNTPEEENIVKEWVESQGSRVYLRDCLSCSIALDVIMKDVNTGERTALGELEYNAKINDDEKAVTALAGHLVTAIQSLPLYNTVKFIAAVPARPGKTTQDLPTELAARIARELDLTDLTGEFRYAGTREQLKALPLAERWAAWEGAQLSLTDEGEVLLTGDSVILIDDKYQSGVSANFVAMILQQHGASDVYGLYAVKTMRDTDNS